MKTKKDLLLRRDCWK